MVPKDGTSLYYFALADTNKDDKVSKGEVREFFQRSGWTESAIENIAVNDFEGEDETWDSEGFNKWFQSKVSMDLGMICLNLSMLSCSLGHGQGFRYGGLQSARRGR